MATKNTQAGAAGQAAALPADRQAVLSGFRVLAGAGHLLHLCLDHPDGACSLVKLSHDGADYLANYIGRCVADGLRPTIGLRGDRMNLVVPFDLAEPMARRLRDAQQEDAEDLPPLFRGWCDMDGAPIAPAINTARRIAQEVRA